MTTDDEIINKYMKETGIKINQRQRKEIHIWTNFQKM